MMADTRKVELPGETIHNITDQPQNEPGNNITPIVELDNSIGSFPPLPVSTERANVLTPLSRSKIPRLKPRQLFPANPDTLASYADQVKLNHEGRTSRPKWGIFPSVLSKSEDRDQKTLVSTPAKRRIDSSSETLKTHGDSLKTNLGRSTSVVSKPESTSRSISVTKPNPRDKTLSLTLHKSMIPASPLQNKPGATECKSTREATPVSYADRVKVKHDVQTCKPRWGRFPSVLTKSKDTEKKMFVSTPFKRKMDSSVETTKVQDQSKNTRFGRSASSLCKPELTTRSVAVTKPNPRSMTLSLTLRKSMSLASPLQNKPGATECKSTREARYPISGEAEKDNTEKTNTDKLSMNLVYNADIPASYADILRVNNDSMEVQSVCENVPVASDESKQGHSNGKTHNAKSMKMDSLCDFDLPLHHVNRLRLKTWELQHECENKDLDLKYLVHKEDSRDMDSECSGGEPNSNADWLKLSTTSPKLQPGCNISPGSGGSRVLDQKCENHNAESQGMDLKPSPDKSVSCADPLKLNCDGRKCKPKWGHFSSLLSKSETSTQKMFMVTPSKRKIDSSCETPKSNVDSQKLNPRTRQLNTKQGQYTSVFSTPERSDKSIAETKSNQIKPLMSVLFEPKGHASPLKLDPEATEFKPRGTRLPLPRKSEKGHQKQNHNADKWAMFPACNLDKLANDEEVLKLSDSKEMLPECENIPADSGKSKQRDQNCEAHNSESGDVCLGCNLDKPLSCAGELNSCNNFREPQSEYELIDLGSSGVNAMDHTYADADKWAMDPTYNPDIPTTCADVVKLNNDFRDLQPECENISACFWETEHWDQNCEAQHVESDEMEPGCRTCKRMSYSRLLTLNTRVWKPHSDWEPIPLGSSGVSDVNHSHADADNWAMDPTCNPDKAASYADVLRVNNDSMEVQPECENVPVVSDESKQGHQNYKTHNAKSMKMDTLCDFDLPLHYVSCLRLKTWELHHECENTPFRNKGLYLKNVVHKEDSRDMDSECSHGEPKSNADWLKLSTTPPKLQPGCKRISPGSGGSRVLDQKCENRNAESRLMDLKPSPDKSVCCADPLKLNSDGRRCKPKWGNVSSLLSKSEKSSQKMFMVTPSKRKIDSSRETPKSNVDSQKLNPWTRQLNTKLGHYTSVFSTPESYNMSIAEPKSNQIKPLKCVLVKPTSHANPLKLNPEAKEFKPRGTRLPLPRKSEKGHQKQNHNADKWAMFPACNPDKVANDKEVLKLNDSKEMLSESENIPADSGESKDRDQNCEAPNSESKDVCSDCNLDKPLSCAGELIFNSNFRKRQPECELIHLGSSGVNAMDHTYADAEKWAMDPTYNPDIPTTCADVVKLKNDFKYMQPECDNVPAYFWETEHWNQNCETPSAESKELDSECRTAKRMNYARLLTLNTRMREPQSEREQVPLGSSEVNATDHLYADGDVHEYKMNAAAGIPAKSMSCYNNLQNNPTIKEYVAISTNTNQKTALRPDVYTEHSPPTFWSSELKVDIPHDNTDISDRDIQDFGRSLPMPVGAGRPRGFDHLADSVDDGPKTPELWRSSAPWRWSNLPPIHKPQLVVPNISGCLRQDEGVNNPAVETQQDDAEKGAMGLLAMFNLFLEAPKLEMNVDEFTKMVGDTFSERWMMKMRIIVFEPPSGATR